VVFGTNMLGWLRRRKPHAHRRELSALLSCLVAWRRAVLEAQYHDAPDRAAELEERLSALRWYAHGAGGTDPFTTHVMEFPLGELDEPLFLLALYRIEVAVGIAWALGLLDSLPPIDEGADVATLDHLLPADGSPHESIPGARLRDREQLTAARGEWTETLRSVRARREETHDESTAVQFSRAFERARALTWVTSNAPFIEDMEPEA
jgi:hypothetical protein